MSSTGKEITGLLSLAVALLALAGSFVVPEVRAFFSLRSDETSSETQPLGYRIQITEELEKSRSDGQVISIGNQSPKVHHLPFTEALKVNSSYSDAVEIRVGVSGRGRTSIDVYERGKLAAHAQDDFFAGRTSLTFRYTNEHNERIRIEIVTFFEKPFPHK